MDSRRVTTAVVPTYSHLIILVTLILVNVVELMKSTDAFVPNNRLLQQQQCRHSRFIVATTRATNTNDNNSNDTNEYFTRDGDIVDDKSANTNMMKGFNPLSYNTASTTASSLPTSSSTANTNIVSLRKLKMTAITNELLELTKEEMHRILETHREFLLEPILDSTAVQDADSIYNQCRTVADRYNAYDTAMEQRIRTARNPAVRNVLTAMRTYVAAASSRVE